MSANVEKRSWKETFRYLAIIVLVFGVLGGARRNYRQSISVLAGIRPLQVVEDAAVVAAASGVLYLLKRAHPAFRWWIGRLWGAKGSPFNFNLLPVLVRGLGPVYLAVFAFVVPQIAVFEENIFRKGTTSWQDAVLRSLLFGLVHMLVGVSLDAAVAIAGAGMWFSCCYFQGGIVDSTVHHATYDLIVVLMLLYMVLFRREKLLASIEGKK